MNEEADLVQERFLVGWCRPSQVFSPQQMHMAGDNPNNFELRSESGGA
jgi:hypothetical protein